MRKHAFYRGHRDRIGQDVRASLFSSSRPCRCCERRFCGALALTASRAGSAAKLVEQLRGRRGYERPLLPA